MDRSVLDGCCTTGWRSRRSDSTLMTSPPAMAAARRRPSVWPRTRTPVPSSSSVSTASTMRRTGTTSGVSLGGGAGRLAPRWRPGAATGRSQARGVSRRSDGSRRTGPSASAACRPIDVGRGEVSAIRLDDLAALTAGPSLLLLHDTLGTSAADSAALDPDLHRASAAHYDDRVWAYDHHTLHIDPAENTDRLLGELLTLGREVDVDVDVVGYGRGGLVARELAAAHDGRAAEGRCVRNHRNTSPRHAARRRGRDPRVGEPDDEPGRARPRPAL